MKRVICSVFASFFIAGCASQSTAIDFSQDVDLAQAAYDYGQIDSAKEKLKTVLSRDPNHGEARLMSARIDLKQDRPKAARQTLIALLEEGGTQSAMASQLLGKLALDENDPTAALTLVDQGLYFEPESAILHNLKAVSLDSLGDFEKARLHYIKALEIEPDNKSFQSNLALSFLLDNQIDKADETLKPLLSANRVPEYVQRNYALILLAQGKEEQASELLAISMSTENVKHDIEMLKSQLAKLR